MPNSPRQITSNSHSIEPDDLEDDDLQELAVMVSEALENGDTHDEIAKDLTNSGWTQEEADEFVASIQYELINADFEPTGGQSEGTAWGWAIGIGIFILIKILSNVFD